MYNRLTRSPKRFVLQPCSGHSPANEATAPPDAYRASNTHACKLSNAALSEIVSGPASGIYQDTGIVIEGLIAELRNLGYERIKIEGWDKKAEPQKMDGENTDAPDAIIGFSSSHGMCAACFQDINGSDTLSEYWSEGYEGRPLYLG